MVKMNKRGIGPAVAVGSYKFWYLLELV